MSTQWSSLFIRSPDWDTRGYGPLGLRRWARVTPTRKFIYIKRSYMNLKRECFRQGAFAQGMYVIQGWFLLDISWKQRIDNFGMCERVGIYIVRPMPRQIRCNISEKHVLA